MMVHFLQGNSDFETTIAVRILLTRFLTSSKSVPSSISQDGCCLIKLYFWRNQQPTSSCWVAGTISMIWCWYRPLWVSDTLQVSKSLLPNAHLPWQHFHLCGFSAEAFLPADSFYNKVVSTNLVQISGWYVQEKDISVQASLLWAEE